MKLIKRQGCYLILEKSTNKYIYVVRRFGPNTNKLNYLNTLKNNSDFTLQQLEILKGL